MTENPSGARKMDPGAPTARTSATNEPRTRVVAREREEHGGIKIGSAFFGWLTATGMAVLLTAVLAAAGTAVGLATSTDPAKAAKDATGSAGTVGLVGGIVLLVILFVSYYCGGYVAGRMARFSGSKQGIAVWLWAVIIAIVVGIIGAIAGAQSDIGSQVGSIPQLPFSTSQLTVAGIASAVAVLVITLIGAILGGITGMRYHRKVDRAGIAADR
jgi:hypothetical protein